MAKTKLYTFYMGLYGAPTRHVFKLVSLAVTWMPSSTLAAHEESIWTSLSHSFTKGGILQLSELV